MASLVRFGLRISPTIQRLATRHVTKVSQLPPRRSLHTSLACWCPGILRPGEDPLKLSNKEWEKRLSPEQYYVCREKGTEMPFSGELVNNHEKGVYCCSCCGAELFSSATKYDSGSGWPSFYEALHAQGKDESKTNVLRCHDNSHGMSREEVVCKKCDAHLGHVFPDGPAPTGMRFCMNSVSLTFEPAAKDSE